MEFCWEQLLRLALHWVETLGQYVPEMIRNGSLEAGAVSVGELVGCSCCFREF